jgi:hypothetical protein
MSRKVPTFAKEKMLNPLNNDAYGLKKDKV